MTDIVLLEKEDFVLLGMRECRRLAILTFYHKQISPDFDHDWIPSISQVLEKTGVVKALQYCCVVWTFCSGKNGKECRITLITPAFFEKYHILAFLYDSCHCFLRESQVCLISFLGDGIFQTTTVSKCILPYPSEKRLRKMMKMTEEELQITIYTLKGSALYYQTQEAGL